jgi:hypothetical protein
VSTGGFSNARDRNRILCDNAGHATSSIISDVHHIADSRKHQELQLLAVKAAQAKATKSAQ